MSLKHLSPKWFVTKLPVHYANKVLMWWLILKAFSDANSTKICDRMVNFTCSSADNFKIMPEIHLLQNK